MNRRAAELYGYTLEELKDKTAFDLYADKDQLEKMMTELRAEGTVKKHEMNMMRKDGTVAAFEISIGLLSDPVEGALGSVCVARDLSPLKEVIEELRRTYREMSQLVAAIPSFLIELDPDRFITRWNSSAERTFGISADNAMGIPLEKCGIRWNWRKVTEAISNCQDSGGRNHADRRPAFPAPGRRRGFLDIMITSVATADCSAGVLLLGSDVTRRKILESQLVQAQKLESIGQLAAGIAHEINTPAQYVGDNTRFLQEAFSDLEKFQYHFDLLLETAKSGKPGEDLIKTVEAAAEATDLQYLRQEIPKAVQQSLEGIERISKIVRAMKEFSHPGTDVKTNVDLNRGIESTITVARNEWKYVADVVTSSIPRCLWCPACRRVQPGDSEHDHQRRARHSGKAGQRGTGEGDHHGRHALAGRGGRNPDKRYRLRHPGTDQVKNLRPVLHDQGGWKGNRPGTGHLSFGSHRQARRSH